MESTEKYKVYEQLLPTSHPDLFMNTDGRLVHRTLGQLNHNGNHLLTMPDGSILRIYHGAPELSLKVLQPQFLKGFQGGDIADIIELFATFASSASPYLYGAAIALKVLDLLSSLDNDTDGKIGVIDQKISSLMEQVGAADYLSLQRAMAHMRANARFIIQTLLALRTLVEKGDATAWYNTQLNASDRQLGVDIRALLDDGEGYFHRVYVESFITGDGLWMHAIPDRPNTLGKTFEYRIALPTLLLLISVRLTLMKLIVPDFVARGTFSSEIHYWWERIEQIATKMANHVRETPVTDLPIQAVRRQTYGGQKLGEFYDWQKHCYISPPYSICPIGAADITTGYSKIDWEHVQFDEWYLAKGDLHGRHAGYWPPSFGPQWYRPPPNATGLPDLAQASQQYFFEARTRARQIKFEVTEEIGVTATSIFAWDMFNLAHPGVGTPI